ncbi:MAG: hypothetical protein ACI89X_003758 [Planctomycetota bacterium]|jgi:hypothetical protein
MALAGVVDEGLVNPMDQPSPAPKKTSKRRLSWRRKLLFAMVPVTLMALGGEWFARSFRSSHGYAPMGDSSYRDHRIDLVRRAFPNVHDALLGYRPKPGYADRKNVWHTQVSIDDDGLRRNGDGPAVPGERRVLAVGDSFTFGDQVSDADTWPAQLEQLLQRPVLNGGVFGYSFAQTVLRAEQLLLQHEVDTVVCSLIPDDIKRCELSRRYTPMPWFAIVNDELEMRGVPVPDTAKDNPLDQQSIRRALGYSALLDMVFWNTCPSWWVGQEREVREHEPGQGIHICKLLLERLQQKCAAKNIRLVLVLQGRSPVHRRGAPIRAAELLTHGEQLGVTTLDLASQFRDMAKQDATLEKKFFRGHMTKVGNGWVAEQLAKLL